MDEADAFIREYSKLLDCTFAEEEVIEFEEAQTFEFLVRCIWKIDPASKDAIPSCTFPRHVTQRLRSATLISDYLKEFNIRGDTGFHNILYGSKNSLRSIFIEVIKKLPSLAEDSDEDEPSENILTSISQKLKDEPSWTPEFCRNFNFSYDGQHWCQPKNSPELHSLANSSESELNHDPRKWIQEFCVKELIPSYMKVVTRGEKPALPPKPITENATNLVESEEDNKLAVLRSEFEKKKEVYETGHNALLELRKANKELRAKIDSYDPRLVQALSDPEYYANQMMETLVNLENKFEMDVVKAEKLKKEAREELRLLVEECKAKGIEKSNEQQLEEILAETENVRKDIERDTVLIKKLKIRIQKSQDDNFTVLEQRCKYMEQMIQKQEDDLEKASEERETIRKRQQRNEESINRSFATIFNTLSQYVDMYRGRQALESFLRIQLYCMEMSENMELISSNKISLGNLNDEIETEVRMNYDRQMELIQRDKEEIEAENERLIQNIRLRVPNFKIEDL